MVGLEPALFEVCPRCKHESLVRLPDTDQVRYMCHVCGRWIAGKDEASVRLYLDCQGNVLRMIWMSLKRRLRH